MVTYFLILLTALAQISAVSSWNRTTEIVGISLVVVGAIAIIATSGFLIYFCCFRIRNRVDPVTEENRHRPLVPETVRTVMSNRE